MIREVRFSDEFQKSFKRLKKRYRSLPEDFKSLLASLKANPFQGDELYDGMRKSASYYLFEKQRKIRWGACYYSTYNR